ncbi:MAG: TRAP transporter small permease [Blautia sp.]|nr:TRAP transporter small permease [Blautia sp.]
MPAFFKTLEKIRPVYDWTYKVLMFICKLLLIGDIVITSWAVAGRYIPFITDPHWSEEIVLTLMVYMAVLSATLAIRKGAHIRMTAFDSYLPRKVLLVSDILADLAVMALGIVLVVYGIKFCNSPLSLRGKYASLPNLGKIWQYLPVPVAGVGMIIFELEQLFQHIEALFVKNEETEEKKA